MTISSRIQIAAPLAPRFSEILTSEALCFLEKLQRRFNPARENLLARRIEVQEKIDSGIFPDFLGSTAAVRAGEWTGPSIPQDLRDRRVEITGPPDRKMVINALNSGAKVYMADFEDSHSPTWNATLEGQINLHDAIRRSIRYKSPEGREYTLNDQVATLFVRPRGWHLTEKHVLLEGARLSASLFDFGLFFFHNAQELLQRGSGPYFYLPKIESHLEARLWNEIFDFAQDELGIPRGTIRATVLIETILAAFEMDEILFELRTHSAGLNCGRWDYIFSFIKKFRNHPGFVLPDRAQVTMETPFLKSYVELLIRTCHRRGVHAMGGMAAQIPLKGQPEKNEAALDKVRKDKLREVRAGHDGTWVAHPGLVPVAQAVFDAEMPQANQISRSQGSARTVRAADLLAPPPGGTITEAGLRTNINIALLYTESWLKGLGCVPLHDLMEDAATAEISRAQIWQWLHSPEGRLQDGRKVDQPLFQSLLAEELAVTRAARTPSADTRSPSRLDEAARLLDSLITSDEFAEFLTLPAYELLEP